MIDSLYALPIGDCLTTMTMQCHCSQLPSCLNQRHSACRSTCSLCRINSLCMH